MKSFCVLTRLIVFILLTFSSSFYGYCQANLTTIQSGITSPGQPEKKIVIPDSLECYMPFKSYSKGDISMTTGKGAKIYSYVNVSCPTCIAGLEEWEKMIPAFKEKGIPVVLICYANDNFEFFKNLCETGTIKPFLYPFYLDNKKSFSKLNPSYRESGISQSILANENNIILYSGDPVHTNDGFTTILKEIEKIKH